MTNKELPNELKYIIFDFIKSRCKVCGKYILDKYNNKICSSLCFIKFYVGTDIIYFLLLVLIIIIYTVPQI